MNNIFKDRKLNNEGTTLVELLVVLAVAAVLMGGIGVSVSLMFSRDAETAGRLIDNELSATRSYAMSKAGTFEMIVSTDGDGYGETIVINQTSDDGTTSEYEKVEFSKSKPCVVTFGVNNDSDGYGSITASPNTEYRVIFDKANGSVKQINGVDITSGFYKFRCVSVKGKTKESDVYLAVPTGRHYIERD